MVNVLGDCRTTFPLSRSLLHLIVCPWDMGLWAEREGVIERSIQNVENIYWIWNVKSLGHHLPSSVCAGGEQLISG